MKSFLQFLLSLTIVGFSQSQVAYGDLVTLNFTQGGYVQSNNSGTFNESANLAVKFDPGSIFTRVGFLKFDLSSISDPVQDVSLSFDSAGGIAGSVSNNSFVYDFTVWILNDGDVNEGWTVPMGFEDGIGIDTASHTPDSAEATQVASFQQTGTGTAGDSFDLNTQELLSAVTNDTDDQLTLIIFRTQDDTNGNIVHGLVRDSFELNITTAIPEPAASLILMVGLVVFSVRRKK